MLCLDRINDSDVGHGFVSPLLGVGLVAASDCESLPFINKYRLRYPLPDNSTFIFRLKEMDQFSVRYLSIFSYRDTFFSKNFPDSGRIFHTYFNFNHNFLSKQAGYVIRRVPLRYRVKAVTVAQWGLIKSLTVPGHRGTPSSRAVVGSTRSRLILAVMWPLDHEIDSEQEGKP